MKRIKLSPINLLFHYSLSIILLFTGGSFIYKGVTEDFPKEMPFEEHNLLLIGTVMIVSGMLTFNREFRKLEFYAISLNGFDPSAAATLIVDILKENAWVIDEQCKDKIIASGANYDNRTNRIFSARKLLTILIVDDTLLLNCLVEPPGSNQVTFGNTRRIVIKVVDAFLLEAS
jgi:hypothetical protein